MPFRKSDQVSAFHNPALPSLLGEDKIAVGDFYIIPK